MQLFTIAPLFLFQLTNILLKTIPHEVIRSSGGTNNIIAYREYLINELNENQMKSINVDVPNTYIHEILSAINDYNKLKVTITRSIGRIRSTYN